MERQVNNGEKSGATKILQWIPLIAVLVAAASLFLTLAFRKKELSCTYLGSTRLVTVEPGGIDPELRIEYHGERVQSLYRMIFALKNTGAAAVKAEDIREPIRLQFPTNVKLLSASLDKTFPQPFAFTAAVGSGSGDVVLQFPLLNSGDEATLSAYVINSQPSVPVFLGRVVDVSNLVFIDGSDKGFRRSD